MMTWLLRALAVLLVLSAVFAGFMGYRLSTTNQRTPAAAGEAGQAAPAPVMPTVMLVHTTQPLRAGTVLGPGMTELRAVPEPAPRGSFHLLKTVQGRVLARDIPADTPLTVDALMAPTSPLQLDLRQGERAVAIKVDELVGLGGFAQAGDLVDVLLFLRPSRETGEASSAQVVLAGARVLAYGDMVTSAEPDEAPAVTAGETGALPPRGGSMMGGAGGNDKEAKEARAKAKASTSAVLAVADKDVSRLMLASNSGVLRLALHPPAPERLATGVDPVADPYFIELGELLPTLRRDSQPVVPASPRTAGPAPGPGLPVPAPAPAVVIHEGEKTRTAQGAQN
ncbi:Flp pilus assembly protein RcpC/CpaB [Thauera humireducens]|uniref:Flp pilus assembly protein CpaB n=1 Tax=Thauera humireducens TaxID=1134435 RepID=UPI002467AAD6|nr:Flp pilus assembly protein CpaB [Thauera humireducens]CAH1746303.1 Flp pilus assembly protein RcpC/CpaB [Thauera humireducens]